MLIVFYILVSNLVKATETHKEFENWLRLVVFINTAGKRFCDNILHEKEKLPRDGKQLCSELKKYNDNMYYKIYKEVLCPSNEKIDKSKFDLMIYVAVIHVVSGATHKFIYKILDMLNKIFHIKDVSIYTKHFEQEWEITCAMFRDQGVDTKPYNVLRKCDLFSVEECTGILESLEFFINTDPISQHSGTG